MTTRRRVLAIFALALTSWPVSAAEFGRLVGFVEDTSGGPVAGAVISLFGKGLGREGLVTLSDSAGRFLLASLPPGSYTLRALGQGHWPAAAQEIRVLANQDSVYSVSLAPQAEAEQREVAERSRELRWLFQHKRRSVLESADPLLRCADADGPLLQHSAPWLSELGGSVEIVATPAALGVGSETLSVDSTPISSSLVRLGGRFADRGHFSLGGRLIDSQGKAWRMATEFAFQAADGHSLQAGAGYGIGMLRPAATGLQETDGGVRGVGAAFAQDRWSRGLLSASLGAHYSYVGYLGRSNYLDPSAGLELGAADGTRLSGRFARSTRAPGGDVLTLSSLSSDASVALAQLDPSLRAERLSRYELTMSRALAGLELSAQAFHEALDDPLVQAFEGTGSTQSLKIANGIGRTASGMGVTVGRRFGPMFHGSVTYSFGHTFAQGPLRAGVDDRAALLPLSEARFHDVVTRFETVIPSSATHVLALYRISTLDPEESLGAVNSRFDVQLRQGLPLFGDLTRIEWELLIAFRNIYYDGSEGSLLDELLVLNPPRRVLGGISVRF